MPPAHADAVVEAGEEGVAFDGLTVRAGEEGFVFETPERIERGLGEDELRSIAVDSPAVTNWYFWHSTAPQRDDHWTFLRWLEGAERDDESVTERYAALDEGRTREWGQLAITVRVGRQGRRLYEIRHVADRNVDRNDLEVYTDPTGARSLSRYDDDRDRYRPLKTAPSLQDGWLFPDLEPESCLATIEWFYPATIANWYRERTDTLDVTHWRETMERQTGMYSLIETWDRGEGHEHVERVARACCVDSQCLKRREWEYDEETDLETPAGDGEFPCREPCSLVISGARKWTRLEGEQSKTYELELTPSETEQLESLVAAIADGRIDDIREGDFDDPANRYRVRFLQATRFGNEEADESGLDADEGNT